MSVVLCQDDFVAEGVGRKIGVEGVRLGVVVMIPSVSLGSHNALGRNERTSNMLCAIANAL